MTFEIEEQILKMTLPQKNGHRIKTPSSSKLTILVSSYWKNFIRNNAHNFFILSLVFLKLLIESVAFSLGHPVYYNKFSFKKFLFRSRKQCHIIFASSCPYTDNFYPNSPSLNTRPFDIIEQRWIDRSLVRRILNKLQCFLVLFNCYTV